MTDFAHTTAAERARQDKAKTLARWCYARGISAGVLELDPVLLRSIARRAGVNPPRQVGAVSPTWQLVVDLLAARAQWDHEHARDAPPAVGCVACALEAPCPHRDPAGRR